MEKIFFKIIKIKKKTKHVGLTGSMCYNFFREHCNIYPRGKKLLSPTGTYHILLLFTNNVFSLLNKGKPSSFLISLSEKSIASNWSNVAPRFSMTGILYPVKWRKKTHKRY